MSVFDSFPLMNAYSINLDWIIRKMAELEKYVEDYTALNKVAYAGVWDITKQYPQWALVTDGDTSWLSLKPVPVGVPLENAEYWQKLADLDPRIAGLVTQVSGLVTQVQELEKKTSNIYNVKDFGATGDGTTDDYGAIQNCMDFAMSKGGGKIVFPSGIYNISKTLVVRPHTKTNPNDKMQNIHFQKMDILQLCGEGFCEIKASASMDYMLKFDDFTYPGNEGGYSNFYSRIENIQLNGGGLAECGVYIYQALHATFERNRIFNVTSTGIKIYGYGELYIANNVIKAPKFCIDSTSGGDSCIFKNDFYPSSTGVCYRGTAYCGSTLFQKNTAVPYDIESASENKSVGVRLYNGKWVGANALTGPVFIANNSFDDIATCVDLYSENPVNNVADIECYHNKISAGYPNTDQRFIVANGVTQIIVHDNCAGIKPGYSLPLHSFIEAINSSAINVHDNVICGSKYGAIILYNCTDCEVKSNTIYAYALSDAGSGAIIFSGNSNNNFAIGNVINQNGNISEYPNLSKNGIVEIETADWNNAHENIFIGQIDAEYRKIGSNSKIYSTLEGYSAPTSKYWLIGSVCKNLQPYADGRTIEWVCAESGTPGRWGAVKWIE